MLLYQCLYTISRAFSIKFSVVKCEPSTPMIGWGIMHVYIHVTTLVGTYMLPPSWAHTCCHPHGYIHVTTLMGTYMLPPSWAHTCCHSRGHIHVATLVHTCCHPRGHIHVATLVGTYMLPPLHGVYIVYPFQYYSMFEP